MERRKGIKNSDTKEVEMKMTWFTHDEMSYQEANELIERYQKSGVQTRKSISLDMKHFLVSALLPEYASEPKGRSQYQSRMWS